MAEAQEKEFAAFGIVNNALKAGIMVGLLSVSICGNIYLVIKIINMQGELYEKMIKRVDEQVSKELSPVTRKIEERLEKVDTAINGVDDATKIADSAGQQILNNNIKK